MVGVAAGAERDQQPLVEPARGDPDVTERRAAILDAEAAVLRTDAAIPMLHERVIQGDATSVAGSVKDPRERTLVTAATHVK